MTEARPVAAPDAGSEPGSPGSYHLGAALVAAVVTAGLAVTARSGALDLLIALAVVQALVVVGWVFSTAAPGRIGQLVIGALAAGAADVAVSVWPHGRLGTLLIVAGLALPVSFAHQLMRGAARARIVESVGGTAVVVVAVVGLAAFVQLRHEFSGTAAGGSTVGGQVVAGVLVAAGGALVVGHLVDLVLAAPRFDPDVPRGLLAVIASAGLGASLGHLLLRSHAEFAGGRGAFTGLGAGLIVALLAVAVAFLVHSPETPPGRFGTRLRPVTLAVLPLAVLGPVVFLLCLVVRT